MKNKLTTVLLFLILLSANAQEVSKEVQSIKKKKNAISLNLGFPGVGLGYARLLNDHFSARLKGTFMNIDVEQKDVALGDRKVDANVKFNFNTYDLWVDYNPFKKSSFKLVGGISYLSKLKTAVVFVPSTTVKYGDLVIPQDQIGDITASADWSNKIVPYLGLGFGRAIPKHNVGFGIEFGGYFIGKPDFAYDGTKMFAPNTEKEKESQEIQNWANQLNVLGNISVYLSFKF